MRRSRTGLAFVGVALSTVLHGIGAAPAQPAMPPAIEPAKSVQGTVSYQGVDASTVRVFAIGNVGTESIELGDGETIYVATPAAGHGTGFMVGNDGLLLTAQHVVDKARH